MNQLISMEEKLKNINQKINGQTGLLSKKKSDRFFSIKDISERTGSIKKMKNFSTIYHIYLRLILIGLAVLNESSDRCH
ncbi:hypothetical protein BpHYR1_022502 [Brachionus plicatilis]|uniref:Uncharacterized protein n=1 Tax=Brachionus plicatilis TaxID=10195 RepID=A0A3M7R4F9_BRAPC|nr:hypothetical protein BpHYR1_022502 [Brachionus plicatilis]